MLNTTKCYQNITGNWVIETSYSIFGMHKNIEHQGNLLSDFNKKMVPYMVPVYQQSKPEAFIYINYPNNQKEMIFT